MLAIRNPSINAINPFIWNDDQYVRDIYPVTHYVNQSAHFLSRQTGQPYDKCRAFSVGVIQGKKWPTIRNPLVNYLHRQENGDREPAQISLTSYIQEIIKNEEIMAPTMTTYIATKHEVSVWADYILMNIQHRRTAKKAKQAAEMAGDKITAFFQGLVDRNTKLSNNAISGAHAVASTPLYNQTNHSTLTSNCRMTSGYGNANNEKLLSGNRHYYHPDVVINNIVSITQNTHQDKWQKVVDKYGLKVPTVDDVMRAVMRSTDLYWSSGIHLAKIRQLVMTLLPIERAAFLYTGDLYTTRQHNNDFMRGFIKQLSSKTFGDHPSPQDVIDTYPEDYVILARQLCVDEMRGVGKDYADIAAKGGEHLKKMQNLEATVGHVSKTLQEYKDFIEVVFVSDNVPAAVPYFPTSVRRSALTSDTDSTIFTVQDWTHWYYGGHVFGDRALIVAATMIFLASQAIVHVLARMSINAGVDRKHMWRIAMKNEYFFPIFVPTEVAKHYYALQEVVEGNIKEHVVEEIKGVHLKSSNAPREINEMGKEMMLRIMNTVRDGKKISLRSELKFVADVERSIQEAIRKGDSRFCRRGEIKSLDSYKKGPVQSNYFHHLFWKEVMSAKYGFTDEPPYAVLKLSGGHNKASDTQAWLEEIPTDMAQRARAFFTKYEKEKLGAFQLPEGVVRNGGIPAEIMMAINSRKMVGDMSNIFYIILKTINYYGQDKKQRLLVSDTY